MFNHRNDTRKRGGCRTIPFAVKLAASRRVSSNHQTPGPPVSACTDASTPSAAPCV
ncbi:hypothetical protein SCP_1801740 [Sparassis crispa]|uniref:Uncharacterized protein n=1 Tax=Sparassis crispa TaxID=139825 RepID=A0A401H713_9APHY|nr:hypothetical protein SCP_1801740 [Sparassis crispa]GBE90150.1 hypothetical protein SCP_1801740 [Sparassis crispa]